MKPYLPIYSRPPNKLIEYRKERFDDGVGHTGTRIVAIYFDKKDKCNKEMTAHIVWDKK
jgi:hypothetical protein